MEVKITIPDDLARDAAEFDLLDERLMVAWLRAALDERVMTLVNEEIQAYRREKRGEEN